MTTRTYRSRVADDDVTPATAGPLPKPCRSCNTLVAHDVLMRLGGRCGPCYSGNPAPSACIPPVPAGVVIPVGPHAFAYRLRARLDAGERLSLAQRESLASFERQRGVARVGADLPLDEVPLPPALPLPDPRAAQRQAERERLAQDPRFAGWVAGAPA